MTNGVYIAATRAPNRSNWEPINGGDGTLGRALGALAAYLSVVPSQPVALLVREQTTRTVRRRGTVIPQEVVEDHIQIALTVENYLASCPLRNDWIERLALAEETQLHPGLAAWQPLSDRGTSTFIYGFWEALRGIPHDTVRWMERGREGRATERARMPELRLGSSAPNAHQAASLRRQAGRRTRVPSPDVRDHSGVTAPRRSPAPGPDDGPGR